MEKSQEIQFQMYARLKSEKKKIEAQITLMQPQLLEVMLGVSGTDTKVDTEIGNFTIKKTKDWTYPENVLKLKEEAKMAQKEAERSGSATFEILPSLYFRLKGDSD